MKWIRSHRLATTSRVVCALCIGSLAACGGSKAETTDGSVEAAVSTTVARVEKQLTVADATVLSRLLFNNYDKGGADVSIDVPFGLQSSIEIDAVVDWKTHQGTAEVRVVGADGALVDTSTVYWRDLYDAQKGLVATTLKGLTEAMAEQGRQGVKYVARPFSETSPLDRVLRYLDGLATVQAENPLLLRQDEKAKSLGTESLPTDGGQRVNSVVLRYGKSSYWADPDSGLLVQASAPLAGLQSETVFRFSKHGARVIELPAVDAVVDAADIPQIYQQLTERK
jgi:hypothetical protein